MLVLGTLEHATALDVQDMLATHVLGPLQTPESIVTTVAWDQRFGRRLFFKSAYLHRNGSHDAIVDPDSQAGTLTLSSTGASKYWELETTARYLGSEHRDLTVSYVRSRGTRDLNDYDGFFGNFKNPIIRRNAHALSCARLASAVFSRVSRRNVVRKAGWWLKR